MRPIIINGFFLDRRQTGIERFSTEITKYIDTICKPNEISVVIPPNGVKNNIQFKNISYIRLSPSKKGRRQWKRIKLQHLLIKNNALSLNYDNTCTILYPGVVFIHDIYCRQFPHDFKTGHDKLTMRRTRLHYWWIIRFAKAVCTVSEYSKTQISKYYGIKPEKIRVIYDSAEYMKNVIPDSAVFIHYPVLLSNSFYFTLGSLSLRKNLKWIVNHAELYPEELFVVSGAALQNVVPPELEKLRNLPNIICTGYLSDGEIKALMQKCKAFIFPSYFEGFGLPPLEALYCGAQIIISNASCLPEIYGDCAHYIDPSDPNVNLDKLLCKQVASPEKLFQKYSLKQSAHKLYKLLKELAE
jgi:glycosyltransferase involved in cell wall biosynthesis